MNAATAHSSYYGETLRFFNEKIAGIILSNNDREAEELYNDLKAEDEYYHGDEGEQASDELSEPSSDMTDFLAMLEKEEEENSDDEVNNL